MMKPYYQNNLKEVKIMVIRLKVPQDAYIESAEVDEEGDAYLRCTWKDIGIEVENVLLCHDGKKVHLGERVLIPYANIAYIVLEP